MMKGTSLAACLIVLLVANCSSCKNNKEPQMIEVKAFIVDGRTSDCPFSTFFGNTDVLLNIETFDGNNKYLWSSGKINTDASFGNNYVVQVPDSGAFTLKASALGPAPPSCPPCYNQCIGVTKDGVPMKDGLPSYSGKVTFTGPASVGATYTIPMDFDVCTC